MNESSFIGRWANEEGDPYVVSLVRLLLAGLIVYTSSYRFLELWRGGYFGDVFHMPVWPEALVPSSSLYAVLLAAQLVLAAAALVGIWPRQTLFSSSLVGLFLLGCDRLRRIRC